MVVVVVVIGAVLFIKLEMSEVKLSCLFISGINYSEDSIIYKRKKMKQQLKKEVDKSKEEMAIFRRYGGHLRASRQHYTNSFA